MFTLKTCVGKDVLVGKHVTISKIRGSSKGTLLKIALEGHDPERDFIGIGLDGDSDNFTLAFWHPDTKEWTYLVLEKQFI